MADHEKGDRLGNQLFDTVTMPACRRIERLEMGFKFR